MAGRDGHQHQHQHQGRGFPADVSDPAGRPVDYGLLDELVGAQHGVLT
ncbi:hypothetical protein [Streptomyces sp. NPDC050504]